MGLKDDLMKAKLEGLKLSGAKEKDLQTAQKKGSPLDIQSEMEKEAIVKFLTEADFKITQLKAPVILENLKTPDQAVNVGLTTLLGDKAPIIDTIKKVGQLIPGVGPAIAILMQQLEEELEKAVKPLLEGGSTLPGLDLAKDAGGLESTGYVYIGEDPDSQGAFDVGDEDGQREFTTVKLIRDDIEDIA